MIPPRRGVRNLLTPSGKWPWAGTPISPSRLEEVCDRGQRWAVLFSVRAQRGSDRLRSARLERDRGTQAAPLGRAEVANDFRRGAERRRRTAAPRERPSRRLALGRGSADGPRLPYPRFGDAPSCQAAARSLSFSRPGRRDGGTGLSWYLFGGQAAIV